ncbi:TadA family conjugal transfer-associated ATPase [Virgisporangium aurantiacum]|nr:TadA family conjugal transfer-associated ATPase [Virgisporangium aurantiacum]
MTATPEVARFADRVRRRLVETGGAPTAARVAATVQAEPGGSVLGQATFARLVGRITDELGGAGPLAPLLAEEEVSDVLVNGAEVWVDRGGGLERAGVDVGRPDDVRRLAQRLAATAGRRLDDGCPYADVPLPDGTRLHAVLPPVAVAGPYLSLRAFRRRVFTLAELVDAGSVSPMGARLLSTIVAGRIAFLITGGTGTGKTTLLSALLSLVPQNERMVLVEDAAELRPAHPHVVTLQARTSNVEGAGGVTLRDLVRQALRMRPDRLVVGECRGSEVVDLLGALNTGHEGGAATLHANTPADVPARLEALGLLDGVPRAALHAQVAAALQVVVHLRRIGGQRVVDEICMLLPDGPDRLVRAVPAWHRERGYGPGAEALAGLCGAAWQAS